MDNFEIIITKIKRDRFNHSNFSYKLPRFSKMDKTVSFTLGEVYGQKGKTKKKIHFH